MNHKIEIEILEPLSEMLLIRAAKDEVSVEELIEQIFHEYLKRSEENAD